MRNKNRIWVLMAIPLLLIFVLIGITRERPYTYDFGLSTYSGELVLETVEDVPQPASTDPPERSEATDEISVKDTDQNTGLSPEELGSPKNQSEEPKATLWDHSDQDLILMNRYQKEAISKGVNPSNDYLTWLQSLCREINEGNATELINQLNFDELEDLRVAFEKNDPENKRAWVKYIEARENSRVNGSVVWTDKHVQARRSWKTAKNNRDSALQRVCPGWLTPYFP